MLFAATAGCVSVCKGPWLQAQLALREVASSLTVASCGGIFLKFMGAHNQLRASHQSDGVAPTKLTNKPKTTWEETKEVCGSDVGEVVVAVVLVGVDTMERLVVPLLVLAQVARQQQQGQLLMAAQGGVERAPRLKGHSRQKGNQHHSHSSSADSSNNNNGNESIQSSNNSAGRVVVVGPS